MIKAFLDKNGNDAHDKRDVVWPFQCASVQSCPYIVETLNHQAEGNDYQQNADQEGRQRLVLATAVAVTIIGTLAREAHHRIDHCVGYRVADAVDAVGQDGAGVPHGTRDDFQRRQAHVARHAHQRAPLFFTIASLIDVFLCFHCQLGTKVLKTSHWSTVIN